MKRILALTKDGLLTYCKASEENKGKGRCNHIAHIRKNETQEEFLKRIDNKKYNKNKMTFEENVILAKRMLVDNVYRAAKIEGIAVTFAETEQILNNKNISKLTPSEINDIINLKRAWEFLLDENTLKRDIGLDLILDIHSIIGKGMPTLTYNQIGVFRKEQVQIGGTKWRPVEYIDIEKIYDELQSLKNERNSVEKSFNIFLWACRNQLFQDGNKRVSSLLANFVLIKESSGIFSIPDDRELQFRTMLIDYYESNDSTEIKEFFYNYCYIYDSSGLAYNDKFIEKENIGDEQ